MGLPSLGGFVRVVAQRFEGPEGLLGMESYRVFVRGRQEMRFVLGLGDQVLGGR